MPLEAVEKDLPDVVILDVRMPGMDGHEALRRIKEMHPRVEVLMLTGPRRPGLRPSLPRASGLRLPGQAL